MTTKGRLKRKPVIVPLIYDIAGACQRLGKEQVLMDCRKAGWIKPVHASHKLVLFNSLHVDACADRILNGEYPE